MKLIPDEQIYMVNRQSFFCMGELPDKHIPRIQMLDGGTGLNYGQLFGDMPTKANHPGKGDCRIPECAQQLFSA